MVKTEFKSLFLLVFFFVGNAWGTELSKPCPNDLLALVKQKGLTESLREYVKLQDAIQRTTDLPAQALLQDSEVSKLGEFRSQLKRPDIERSHLLASYEILKEKGGEKLVPISPVTKELDIIVAPTDLVPRLGSYESRHYYTVKNKQPDAKLQILKFQVIDSSSTYPQPIETGDGKILFPHHQGVRFYEKNSEGIYLPQKTKPGVTTPQHAVIDLLYNGTLTAKDSGGRISLFNENGVYKVWERESTSGFIPHSPVPLNDDSLLVSTSTGDIYRLHKNGKKLDELKGPSGANFVLPISQASDNGPPPQFAVLGEEIHFLEQDLYGGIRLIQNLPLGGTNPKKAAVSQEGMLLFVTNDGFLWSAQLKNGEIQSDKIKIGNQTGDLTLIEKGLLIVPHESPQDNLILVRFDPESGKFLSKSTMSLPIPQYQTHNYPLSNVASLGEGGFAILSKHGLAQYKKTGDEFTGNEYTLHNFIVSSDLEMSHPTLTWTSDGNLIVANNSILVQLRDPASPSATPDKSVPDPH